MKTIKHKPFYLFNHLHYPVDTRIKNLHIIPTKNAPFDLVRILALGRVMKRENKGLDGYYETIEKVITSSEMDIRWEKLFYYENFDVGDFIWNIADAFLFSSDRKKPAEEIATLEAIHNTSAALINLLKDAPTNKCDFFQYDESLDTLKILNEKTQSHVKILKTKEANLQSIVMKKRAGYSQPILFVKLLWIKYWKDMFDVRGHEKKTLARVTRAVFADQTIGDDIVKEALRSLKGGDLP